MEGGEGCKKKTNLERIENGRRVGLVIKEDVDTKRKKKENEKRREERS